MEQEQQIWSLFRAGDRDALAGIADLHYRSLLRYGMKFGLDEAEVQDCIQDLFLDLWQNRSRVGDTGSVKNYLLKSVRNRVIDCIRHKQRFGTENDLSWQINFSDFHTVEKEWIEKEHLSAVGRQLHQYMEELPKREKEALYLRYYENLSLPEIAEVMGVNRQSVANFLQKALHKLRSRWALPLIALFNFLSFFSGNRV